MRVTSAVALLLSLLGAVVRMRALLLQRRHELLVEAQALRFERDRSERQLLLEATAHLVMSTHTAHADVTQLVYMYNRVHCWWNSKYTQGT